MELFKTGRILCQEIAVRVALAAEILAYRLFLTKEFQTNIEKGALSMVGEALLRPFRTYPREYRPPPVVLLIGELYQQETNLAHQHLQSSLLSQVTQCKTCQFYLPTRLMILNDLNQ